MDCLAQWKDNCTISLKVLVVLQHREGKRLVGLPPSSFDIGATICIYKEI